ncbi:MAG: SDR family NAD(P)-dependent oxidoreductase, partial [Planctomycetota bacterium]
MPPALENRTVVIVGGTAGLGLSAAKACVTAGASVVVVGRNADGATQACGELGPSARACVGDASLPGTATTAIETAIDAFGRFDSLYHVAGGSGRKWGDGPLHELTDEAVEATLRLNLASLIYSNRAAVRTLLKRKSPGSILNMGSVLGSSPSPRFFATHVYAAAKSAIVGFTKSCAAYYAKYDIRFNVVAPALVDTPMARRAAEDPQINKY